MIRLCNEVGLREPDFAIRDGFVQTLWRPLPQKQAQADLSPKEMILLTACSEAPALGQDLLAAAGYQRRTGNFKRRLEKLLAEEWLAPTIPDKPPSPKQRYGLTTKGQALLGARKKLTGIGKPERGTQGRVAAFFLKRLGYRHLDDWTDRPGNSNIDWRDSNRVTGQARRVIRSDCQGEHGSRARRTMRAVASMRTTKPFTTCSATESLCKPSRVRITKPFI